MSQGGESFGQRACNISEPPNLGERLDFDGKKKDFQIVTNRHSRNTSPTGLLVILPEFVSIGIKVLQPTLP